jgi:hypothetical protein
MSGWQLTGLDCCFFLMTLSRVSERPHTTLAGALVSRDYVFRIQRGKCSSPVKGERLGPLCPKETVHFAPISSHVCGLPTVIQIVRNRRGMEVEWGNCAALAWPVCKFRS